MLGLLIEFSKSAVLAVQEYVQLQVATIRGVFSRPFYFHDVVEQFDAIGIGSLTVVLLTGFFTGAVLALQSGITLDQFGARPFVGRLISASMIKELGPVLTGLMLAGRIGSGIAAELGSMVVTDQIKGQTHGCDAGGGPTLTGGDTNSDGLLQSTETWTYSCTYTVQHGDEDSTHHIVNTAHVTATDGSGHSVSDDASWTTLVIHPLIAITKSLA